MKYPVSNSRGAERWYSVYRAEITAPDQGGFSGFSNLRKFSEIGSYLHSLCDGWMHRNGAEESNKCAAKTEELMWDESSLLSLLGTHAFKCRHRGLVIVSWAL